MGENRCGRLRERWLATAGLHCCEPAITGGHKINVATETLHKNWPTFGHQKKKKKLEEEKEAVKGVEVKAEEEEREKEDEE